MKTDELREKYLSFFESHDHVRRPSDVLVPRWDPSVLFTPAGMNQFKDHFLGKVKLDFARATTCQKCLRTGDIGNVGRTAYHHTFFEMLGNFSFGDYFKREAIRWAWEFLTHPKWLGMEMDRLSVSVYVDDEEAARIWAEDIGLAASRIERMGEDENFWPANAPSQGPDGVCGPCSEIFFHPPKGTPVEIWNLVFTQYHRVGEPPDNLRPLPSKNIDTGMGLERTASVLQGVDTNFHIDILKPIVQAAAEVCSISYDAHTENGRRLRRIADHIRACCFAVHENVYPGPNKEKYVVRRLLRRAVLDGHHLGCRQPFLFHLVAVVVETMRQAYPELCDTARRVESVVRQEEERFFSTIDDGLERIEKIFQRVRQTAGMIVDGRQAAELYQTYGVPPELVEAMAAEHGLAFDWEGFTRAMESHGDVSGKQQFELFKTGPVEAIKKAVHATKFLGYETTEAEAEVKAIIVADQLCDQLIDVPREARIIIVLDQSPFYGEAGGQVGDTGRIESRNAVFEVTDTQRDGDLILHYGSLDEGTLSTGDRVVARVDQDRRAAIRRAHTATHILHYALQKHLGTHAQQQGSKVDQDWLRFDFTNLSPVTGEQLASVEAEVHDRISDSDDVECRVVPLSQARDQGAMMLFGEKYPDPVRMVSMGSFSRELCGGTHLDNTHDVGSFAIVAEEAVAAGTRRVTALTGNRADAHQQEIQSTLMDVAHRLGVEPLEVPHEIEKLSQHLRDLKKCLSGGGEPPEPFPQRELAAAKIHDQPFPQIKDALKETARILNVGPPDVIQRVTRLLQEVRQCEQQLQRRDRHGTLSADQLLELGQSVGGATVVVAETPGITPALMRRLIDEMRRKGPPVAALLAAAQGNDKISIVAGISDELRERGARADQWVRQVAQIVGGGGGGRPDMAQAGGKSVKDLPKALQTARQSITSMLQSD